MRTLKFKEAIAEALVQAMEKDGNVFVMGEGTNDYSGIFGTTIPVTKRFPERVMDMPLSEALITGVGTGAALVGLRPVMVHARNDFVYLALDQIANHAAFWSEMHGGGINIPWVIRALVGRGWGNAAQHSQSLQAIFAHIPGLKVVVPATPFLAKGLLLASIEDNSPVMFIEHRSLYEIEGRVPEGYYLLPLNKANVLKDGSDLTFISVSFMTAEAMKAACVLKQKGVQAEVVDVTSLKPLDRQTICESVEKTGRAIVLDTGWKSFGASAEITAVINEQTFGFLKAPVTRLALPDSPTPCSSVLEKKYFPSIADIVNAALELLNLESMSKEEIGEEETQFTGPF